MKKLCVVFMCLLTFSVVFHVSAQAPYLFTEDFESWNENDWDIIPEISIDGDAARYGNYGLKVVSDGTSINRIEKDYEEHPMLNFSVSFWFRAASLNMHEDTVQMNLFEVRGWILGYFFILYTNASQNFYLYSSINYEFYDLDLPILTGLWYYIEMNFDDASGFAELKINGVQRWVLESGSSREQEGLPFDYLLNVGTLQAQPNDVFELHYDDVTVSYFGAEIKAEPIWFLTPNGLFFILGVITAVIITMLIIYIKYSPNKLRRRY